MRTEAEGAARWRSGPGTRFAVLGRLHAARDGDELALGSPQQRAVLALLLLRRGRPVTREEIVRGLWRDGAPASAANLVHTYVARLRRVLEPERPRRAPASLLVSVGDGYLLRLRPGQVDLEVFEARVGLAGREQAAGRHAAASEALDDALGLWHGEALGGVPGPFVSTQRTRLAELHLATLESALDIRLVLGRHGELVSELSELVARHPLRERLRALLMLALYRSGRRAEALAVFQDTRRHLVEELGLEPGPELRELQHVILTGAGIAGAQMPRAASWEANISSLAAAPAGMGALPVPAEAGEAGALSVPSAPAGARVLSVPSAPAPSRTVPAQLPHDGGALVGREAELNALDAFVAPAHHRNRSVVITITGPAGIGKTALAVHWARRIAPNYPDGQLYLDLRAFTVGAAQLSAEDALSRLLRSLGHASYDAPVPVEERAALFRTLISDRRMVVVLDNAPSARLVRQLLPGATSCVVVVTSRNRLDGLVAQHSARPLTLSTLNRSAAVEVLRRGVGEDRVGAEPDSAGRLADLAGRLPFALQIAAARLAAQPQRSIAELVTELSDERHRLSALSTEDGDITVRAALDVSFEHLGARAARLFVLLGLVPGPAFTLHLAAALAGTVPAEVRGPLNELLAAHLLTETHPGRYALHDLVRLHAVDAAEAGLREDERRTATHRLLVFSTGADQPMRSCAVSSPPGG